MECPYHRLKVQSGQIAVEITLVATVMALLFFAMFKFHKEEKTHATKEYKIRDLKHYQMKGSP